MILCRLADLAATGAREIIVSDAGVRRKIFVVRHAHGIASYFNACPHARLPLNAEPDVFFDVGRSVLVCVNHGAHFEPGNGLCLRGPCKGERLRPFPIRIDGEDIHADDPDYAGA